jgi:hypothetical protein
MAHVVLPSMALAFVIKMSGKHKSTSPSAIQVKNWQQTSSIEEELVVMSRFDKGEQIVTYAVMLDSFVVYVQFVIILIELKKVLSQELKCLSSKTTTFL